MCIKYENVYVVKAFGLSNLLFVPNSSFIFVYSRKTNCISYKMEIFLNFYYRQVLLNDLDILHTIFKKLHLQHYYITTN